jgi:hypothetical protein
MAARLVIWLIFSVVLALVPIGYTALSLLTHNAAATMDRILEHGELYILAASLCAAAVGDLLASGDSHRTLKRIFGGLALTVLLAAALAFADVAAAWLQPNVKLASAVVTKGSIIIFSWAIVTCGGCVLVADADK